MSKFKSEIIILTVFILIGILVIGYNIYSAEMQKREEIRLAEEARLEEERARLERERLEELRSRETLELIDYYLDYSVIREEFREKTVRLSEEMEGEIVNIAQLKEITSARLDAAMDYRDKFTASGIPGPLEAFYEYELEFIESDIETIREVLLYYGSDSYSTYDNSAIGELYRKTGLLLHKAEEELESIYRRYELEYLLE